MRLTEAAKELSRNWSRFIRDNEKILEEEMYTLTDGKWTALAFCNFFKRLISHSGLNEVQWKVFIYAYKSLKNNPQSVVPQELLNATIKELRNRRDLSVYCH